MNDLDRMLRETAREVLGSTRVDGGFLDRARTRARRRRQRRIAACSAMAVLVVIGGAVGIQALRNEPTDVTVIAASTPEPTRPVLTEEQRVLLGDSCRQWVPEVQSAEVVFATPAGYTAVVAVLSDATAAAQQSLDQLVDADVGPLRRELATAEDRLVRAASAVAADHLDDAAVELESARSALATTAEILADWGVDACATDR